VAVAGALVALAFLTAPPAASVGASGGSPPEGRAAFPSVPPGTYSAPVDRPVSDPFRLDAGQYGPGNRGLEYDTAPGDPVRAVAAGRVAFAGPVAGRLVVSVVHPDGRRSTLTGLRSVLVRVGDLVARGSPVGTAGPGLHLGLLEGRRYVDPAPFLAGAVRRAVLVSPGGARAGRSAIARPGSRTGTVAPRSAHGPPWFVAHRADHG